MGDADWLRESGLNWGWDDNYPSFRDPVSPYERWQSRKLKNNRYEISDQEAIEISVKLVDVKKKIKTLQVQEESLKKELFRIVPTMGYLNFTDEEGDYIVEKIKSHKLPVLSSKKVYALLKRKYGEEASKAIMEESTNKSSTNTAIYVRIFPKKNERNNEEKEINLFDDFDDEIPF